MQTCEGRRKSGSGKNPQGKTSPHVLYEGKRMWRAMEKGRRGENSPWQWWFSRNSHLRRKKIAFNASFALVTAEIPSAVLKVVTWTETRSSWKKFWREKEVRSFLCRRVTRDTWPLHLCIFRRCYELATRAAALLYCFCWRESYGKTPS